MDKQPTEAPQDELAGILDKIFEIVDSANFKDGPTSIEAFDQILSLTVSSGGGVCQECENGWKWVNKPFREPCPSCKGTGRTISSGGKCSRCKGEGFHMEEGLTFTCPPCNGTGQKPIVTKAVGEIIKEWKDGI